MVLGGQAVVVVAVVVLLVRGDLAGCGEASDRKAPALVTVTLSRWEHRPSICLT